VSEAMKNQDHRAIHHLIGTQNNPLHFFRKHSEYRIAD
jgi:hypothetical protein